MERIQAIKERVEISTQGKMYQHEGDVRLDISADWVAEFKEETDAELFIHAKEDIEYLLAENKRLTHIMERIISSCSMPGVQYNELVQHIERLAKEALREDEKE